MKILTEHGMYIVPHFSLTIQDGTLKISTEKYHDWKFYPFPEDDDCMFTDEMFQDEGWPEFDQEQA